MDPEGLDYFPAAVDINIVLAGVLKGLPDMISEKLDTVLKDIPLPDPGGKSGLSVQEAVEVSLN